LLTADGLALKCLQMRRIGVQDSGIGQRCPRGVTTCLPFPFLTVRRAKLLILLPIQWYLWMEANVVFLMGCALGIHITQEENT